MPDPKISGKYYITEVRDGKSGFAISLAISQDPSQHITIVFENSVVSYTHTDESFEVSTISELDQRYGSTFYGE